HVLRRRGLKVRAERGKLDRDVNRRHAGPESFAAGRRKSRFVLRKRLQQFGVAFCVGIGLSVGKRLLTQQVHGVARSPCRQLRKSWDRIYSVGSSDEPAGHGEDALSYDLGEDWAENGLRGQAGSGLNEPGSGASEVLSDVIGDGARATQGRKNVNEAQQLHPETRVRSRPVQEALLEPGRCERQWRVRTAVTLELLFQPSN